MARRLRHEDPRQGREHFDLIAGREWEYGPDPNDITGSTPDLPRNRLKPASIVIHSKGQWAVTDFGLELVSDLPDRNDIYKIPAYELLDELVERNSGRRFYKLPLVVAMEPWADLDCFDAFEDCFYAAMPVHCRTPLPIPQTFIEVIKMHLYEEKYGKRTQQDQPCRAEADVLDRTLREARAIIEKRAAE